jgi:biofilm protein TabA
MKIALAYKKCALVLLIMFIVANLLSAQAKTNDWTAKTANKWIKSRQWSSGLAIKAHHSVNKVEFARQYNANKTYWDEAFLFMRDKNLKDLPPGKYVIDGDNVFATVTYGPSKTFEQSAWESHRKYIDLQYVISGKEKIGVSPLADATVIRPYSESSDGANYTAKGRYYIATPKAFFLFFPGDVHRPNIKVDGFDTVKKLVIKIRVSA